MEQRNLPFSNRWMFNRVMLQESICRKVIRATTGIKAKEITYLNAEQVIEPSPDNRGVRMDIFAQDDSHVYDIEMQVEPELLLGKRFRYYQSALDMRAIPRGSDYDGLTESFIVFICVQDPFQQGLPVYTIERSCREAPHQAIGDESHWIALNAEAWSDLANEELLDLLRYVETDEPDGPLSQEIHAAVSEANADRKWVGKVWSVSTIEENDARRHRIGLRLARKEGIEEGLAQGIEQGIEQGAAQFAALADELLDQGRLEDLKRAAHDKEFRDQLLREFESKA